MNQEQLHQILERTLSQEYPNLILSDRRIKALPPFIGELTNVNRIFLASNKIETLPPQIGRLKNLEVLDLRSNKVRVLPLEFANLEKLVRLLLDGNLLSTLPPSLSKLGRLSVLSLSGNELCELPSSISGLHSLQHLDLDDNQLTTIGDPLGSLAQLRSLSAANNRISQISPAIGNLSALEELDLSGNSLTQLPAELSKLPRLELLNIEDNPDLRFPPPEVTSQGGRAILRYLKAHSTGKIELWRSKLLILGEGGAGKTSLMKRLGGGTYNPGETTTHGIRIHPLSLPHPERSDVTMVLNTWDFGGQQIYHATHQFFLTDRSLFILVWNARLGHEQGRLHYWLDMIQAKAPQSPVLIVATHVDQRAPDFPYNELAEAYPQIAGSFEISNLDGRGISALRAFVALQASQLPLMGGEWPDRWMQVADEIRDMPERHVTPKDLERLAVRHEVLPEDLAVLTQSLHELGDILYFQKDSELRDFVFLNPQWVSSYISRVLDSDTVLRSHGLLTRTHMDEVWADLDPEMRLHLLQLMEKFDISYRTMDDKDVSFIVERLPFDEPPEAQTVWREAGDRPGASEIRMRYRLNTVPPGIPTWFIARSYRFSIGSHWRSGALLADGGERKHLARMRVNAHNREVELSVKGPYPQEFFSLLREGFEVTLQRFPGLGIQRRIPCSGHDDEPCAHEFDYEHLLRRLERTPPRHTIECPIGCEDMSIDRMLFGLHESLESQVVSAMQRLEGMTAERTEEDLQAPRAVAVADADMGAAVEAATTAIVDRISSSESQISIALQAMKSSLSREFLKLQQRDQRRTDAACPRVFSLRPKEGGVVGKILSGQKFDMHLYCEAPGEWHPATDFDPYEIAMPREWFVTMAPYLREMVRRMRYVLPIINSGLGTVAREMEETLRGDIDFMGAVVDALPSDGELLDAATTGSGSGTTMHRARGAQLRALHQLLTEKDPHQIWGRLELILTPENHWLWLCPRHAAEYRQ